MDLGRQTCPLLALALALGPGCADQGPAATVAAQPLAGDPLSITEFQALRLGGGPNAQLGWAVDVHKDWAVLSGNSKGALYIFQRGSAGWTLRQHISGSYACRSVALDGDTLLCGSSSSARVYTRGATGQWTLQQTLLQGTKGNSSFGEAVALSGNTAVVGAYHDRDKALFAGSAHVFVRGAGGTWTLQQQLFAADADIRDYFGISVAVDQDTLLVGASGDSDSGAFSGSVYVFTRTAGKWTQQQKLTASDGAAKHYFGAVSLQGATAVVGAYGADAGSVTGAGAAYVFTRVGGKWAEQQKLVAADAAKGDQFGFALRLDQNTVVVGAPYDGDRGDYSGSAYVFTRSGSKWTQQQKLTDVAGRKDDRLARAVALHGDTLVIGAHQDDGGGYNSGAGHVFTRGVGKWSQQGKLPVPSGNKRDSYGRAVALEGDLAAMSAPGYDYEQSSGGVFYAFMHAGGKWTLQHAMVSHLPGNSHAFGTAMAISGKTLVVGANQDAKAGPKAGLAMVYLHNGSEWIFQYKLYPLLGWWYDRFGRAVAIHGDTAVVSAPYNDTAGVNAGTAYVFVRAGTVWTQQQQLLAADAAAGDFLGHGVAIHQDTLALGVPSDDDHGTSSGSVYLFTRSNSKWTQQQKLSAKDAAAGDSFGWAVALHGDLLVVGAPSDDGNAVNTGAAYVFRRSGGTWTQQQKFTITGAAADDRLGHVVDTDGDTVVVGAPNRDSGGNKDSGAVYLYVWSGAQWVQRAVVVASNGAARDQFGGAVSLDGTRLVVGADRADRGKLYDIGAAYIYELLAGAPGAVCAKGKDCLNLNCVDGRCCRGTCAGPCKGCDVAGAAGTCTPRVWGAQLSSGAAGSCAGTMACDGLGACKSKIGQPCTANGACLPHDKTQLKQGGRCVDGVCCGAAACATCQSCALAGSAGQCKALPKGQPDTLPAGACAYGRACDGAGACKLLNGRQCKAASECLSQQCVDGRCCDAPCAKTCWSCAAPGLQGVCSPLAFGADDGCDTPCQTCAKGACASLPRGSWSTSGSQSCTGVKACDGAGACKKANAQPCLAAADCASGFCVDSVCCASACAGACSSCAMASSVGSCALVPAGQDPDQECAGKHASCAGACDGAGQCRFAAATTRCGLCATCDAKGGCSAAPADDPACGAIDCDQLDTACQDFHDLATNRCAAAGRCKAPNIASTCITATPRCSGPDAAPDAGPDAGPDQGSAPPVATGGGCSCRAAGQGASTSLLALLLGLGLWLRRGSGPRVRGTCPRGIGAARSPGCHTREPHPGARP